MYRSRSTH